jgi:hypothetical protein
MPKRIQLQRTKDWRKPAGAIVVARPSRWGNPIHVGAIARCSVDSDEGYFEEIPVTVTAAMAVEMYRDVMRGRLEYPTWENPHVDDVAYT